MAVSDIADVQPQDNTITYDTYGFESRDLEGIATEIGKALGLRFLSRKNPVLGRLYQAGKPFKENFDLLHNGGEFDDQQWLEPEFQQFNSILYVNQSDRHEEIEKVIAENFERVRLIRRVSYPTI